jgi:hypothetical protein
LTEPLRRLADLHDQVDILKSQRMRWHDRASGNPLRTLHSELVVEKTRIGQFLSWVGIERGEVEGEGMSVD